MTVNKEGPNNGRQFYNCPLGVRSGCDFFQWATDPTTHSNQKQIKSTLNTSSVLSEIQLNNVGTSQLQTAVQQFNQQEEPKSDVSTNLKRKDWGLDEVKDLIEICAVHNLLEKAEIQPSKNVSAYGAIQNFMVRRNHSRSQQQLHRKICQLKKDYVVIKSKEGQDLQEILKQKKHYELLYNTAILKKDLPCLPTPSTIDNVESVSQNLEDDTSRDNSKSFNDSIYWSNDEITDLLTLCIERNLFEFKDNRTLKNREIYQAIHRSMQEIGSKKSYDSMVNKINSLNSDFQKIQRALGKSGESGLSLVIQKKPYYPKMVELFGRRPKATSEPFDSISLTNLLDTSIIKDEETKEKFPKPQSAVENLLSKNLEASRKHDFEILDRCLKHEETIAEKNREFLAQALKESAASLGAVLKEALQTNPAPFVTQFSPHAMQTQNFANAAVPSYANHPIPIYPVPSMQPSMSAEKRPKKDKYRNKNKHFRHDKTLQ